MSSACLSLAELNDLSTSIVFYCIYVSKSYCTNPDTEEARDVGLRLVLSRLEGASIPISSESIGSIRTSVLY